MGVRAINDENGEFYIELYEEAHNDIKIMASNIISYYLKNKEGEELYEQNEDCTIVSVYIKDLYEYNSTIKNEELLLTSMYASIYYNALNNNPDWHLTINFYDYDTKELLKSDVIR